MNLPINHYGLKGRCKVSVVERGRVVREYPPISNLILNRGLDDIASNFISDCFQWCAAGTGSTATELDATVETATISAGTVTISTIGFLNGDSTDVGKTIKLTTSGNLYTITSAISTTQCVVTPNDTIGPDQFIVYNTNQTGLTSESTLPGPTTKRTQTYLTGAPNCQTVTQGAVTVMTRTFDFVAETGPITYNEVGFSTVSTIGSNLFSRVKLPAGVPLTSGQQLRVQYSVSVTVSPVTPQTYGVSPIIGWNTATGTFQHILVPLKFVSTSGITAQGLNTVDSKNYGSAGEPSNTNSNFVQIESVSTAHPAYGSVLTVLVGNAITVALSSYVSGTYTRDKFGTYPVGQVNATNWRSWGICVNFGDGFSTYGPRFLFDSAQTKLSTFTLTLGVRTTWGRIL